jgi:hypothetical protein
MPGRTNCGSDKWQVGQMTHFMYRLDKLWVGQMAGRTNDAFYVLVGQMAGRTNDRLDKCRSDKRRSDKRRSHKTRGTVSMVEFLNQLRKRAAWKSSAEQACPYLSKYLKIFITVICAIWKRQIKPELLLLIITKTITLQLSLSNRFLFNLILYYLKLTIIYNTINKI